MTTQPVSSSPSSFSSFTHNSSCTYDVFLSFRGEDTRTNFTDHLYKALSDKKIHTFIDRELVKGEEISSALVKAIEESRISLIVFSENYASSRWCLDELVKILQCKQSKQQIVLPFFYKVDPSDVRHQRSSYGDAFVHHERKFKDDKEKVLKWRRALTEAANLSGWHLKEGEYETAFINNIVDGILSQVLSRTYLNVPKYAVGIQSHVQDVEMLLDVGGNGRHMVGIWGTSGIGKTTIAKAICNAVAYKFEGSCFLPNVREGSLIQLQKTLLQEILGGKKLKIASADKGISIIHNLLRHKKILLILDDVNQLEQLDNLAGVGWFGEGSRVLITTQDSGLLKCHGIKLIYEVQKLRDYQALELFSLNAFGINEPPKDYLELAQRAIAFANGLPLALTILGSHLRNRDKTFWQGILDGFKGEPYTHIERILQKSYDALDDYAKEVFLDIACFFKGGIKDYVLQIVPKNCIEVLVDKAMITVEWDKRILMHDLLANLGKDIVRKESPNDPGQRSRLWFYEDVKQVLTENTGTRNIKGIMVKFPEPAEITLNPECFRNMVNLQIFINHNASLCGHINYLPNALRWIDWKGYQLQSLPSEFDPVHLTVFNMPGGSIRRLEKLKNMSKLTSMNLRGCQFLEKIPDLSGIPNIKYLDLCRCTSLVEVDDSVGRLDKLVELNLRGCVRLTRFATRLRLKSLKTLYLIDCKRLESFPEIEVEIESLRSLYISRSGIRELPSSITYLTGLDVLEAEDSELQLCPNLSKFCLKGCSQIRKLERFKNMPMLTSMNLSGCQFLAKIPDLSGIPNIEHLNLSRCTSLVEIDDSIGLLDKLVTLELDGCIKLTRFATRHRLNSLEQLYLGGCKRLESIPELENMPKLVILNLDGCVNLTRFATRLRLNSLKRLNLPGDEVPKWFSCREDATLVKEEKEEYHKEEYHGGCEVREEEEEYEEEYEARCKVSFEIPQNLKWETLRLVLCVVAKVSISDISFTISLNGQRVNEISLREREYSYEIKEGHVRLACIPLLDWFHLNLSQPLKPGSMCKVDFLLSVYGRVPAIVKIPCGVHLLGHQVADVSVTEDFYQRLLPEANDDQHKDYESTSLSFITNNEHRVMLQFPMR
ncbi:TMV resistance protein N-like isoform X2 [Prunus avium]|uniref:TMV resistance protein N-like isoform X2 n=1 Tax=Prunus avium TaxID=42229 RepID=A0A6P5TS40_PRUAV|nr:TMV resistance protein N-like isoform X2 [Prunus avium]